MGIPALWKLLGDGEIISMAELASDHYNESGRALKVAIDEAGWRFKNLTETQVAAVRQKEPAANPIEKAIFWRICRLMRAHIHPIFVLDGPGRPWKRGRRGGGKVDYERTRLLVQLLDRMRIPHHRAPGEAEAECARMQQLGVVDAVWSDDADSLMFGATVLIKDHRDSKSKTAKHESLVQVYRMSDITAKHGLDAQGIVAYVTLVGGDYDMKGLLNCGEEIVNKMAHQGYFRQLGRTLCAAQSELDLFSFRQELAGALAEVRKRIPIPADFPRWLAAKHYKNPKVSTTEQLISLPIAQTLGKPINHDKLREILRERFNIWTKGYLKYIAPLLLLRELAATEQGQEQRNDPLAISIVKKRKKAGLTEHEPAMEIAITYSPSALMPATIYSEPPEEDWRILATNNGPFKPAERLEIETLRCLVVRGKGKDVFDAEIKALETPKSQNNRKRKAVPNDRNESAAEHDSRPNKPRRTSKPLKAQTEANIERERQERLKRREKYNASKNNKAGNHASDASTHNTATSIPVGRGSTPHVLPPATSIDLTHSDDDRGQTTMQTRIHDGRFRTLSMPSAQRTPDKLASGATFTVALDGCMNSARQNLESSEMYDEAAFEAHTLAAIHQSLIDARMLPSARPAAKNTMEDFSVNVRVATPAARSLLLSPGTAVRQRWAAKQEVDTTRQDGVSTKQDAVPAFNDLTTF